MIKLLLRFGLLAMILALAACGGTTAPTPAAPAEGYVCKGKINSMSYVVEVGTTQVGNYEVECSEDEVVLTHTSLTDCNGQYESKEKKLVYSMRSGDVWTVGETNLSCPKAEATAAPEPTETVVLTPTFTLNLDGFDGPITMSGWAPSELSPNGGWYQTQTALDSWKSVSQTWKRASTGCNMPGACNVYGPEGVLLADDYKEAQANGSAVWGGIWHGSPDNAASEFSMLCPEGSYCDAYALNFGRVEIGPAGNPFIVLNIPTCGAHCGQGLLIRNWLERPGEDLNTTVIISDYGAPGAASWTEYTVEPAMAQWFSQGYSTAQAENAHERNNNGSGPGDNDRFYQWVLDLNDMSLTLMLHTADAGWETVWTNVVAYGTH